MTCPLLRTHPAIVAQAAGFFEFYAGQVLPRLREA